jgi:hypothetical protein
VYRNPDPGVEKDALETAAKTTAYFEQEIKRLIDNKYYRKSWTILSTELRLAVIEELLRIFNVKLVEMRQVQRSNDWKYRSQDETNPNLKDDLKKIYLGYGCGLLREDKGGS